jgi:hypothetical protein
LLCVVAAAAFFCLHTGLCRAVCLFCLPMIFPFDFLSCLLYYCLEEASRFRLPHTYLFFESLIVVPFFLSSFCEVFSRGQIIIVILFYANEFSILVSSLKMLCLSLFILFLTIQCSLEITCLLINISIHLPL